MFVMYYAEVFFVCFLLTVFLSHFKISLLDLSIPTKCRAKGRKMSCIMGVKRGPATGSIAAGGRILQGLN